MSEEGLTIGNVRVEDGKIRASFMQPGADVIWFDLEPDFAASFGHALIAAAEPSVWKRLAAVWRKRYDVEA